MYIIYVANNVYITYIMYVAYISSHSKGPEQDPLRSPFVPYVRNTAERSIHNFDSGPYVYICPRADTLMNIMLVYCLLYFFGFHSHDASISSSHLIIISFVFFTSFHVVSILLTKAFVPFLPFLPRIVNSR